MPEIDGLWGVGRDEEIIAYCKTFRDSQESGAKGEDRGYRIQEA
jgi:hypothetical protein